MAWTEIWSMNLIMELKQMKTKDKEQVSTKRIRMFAPFKDMGHYNTMLEGVLNPIPKKHHFNLHLILQMMISTWKEDPELAKKMWK